MSKLTKREVYYFDKPGEHNTDLVIEAVVKRLEAGGVSKVIVASTSGETALKFAHSLQGKGELVCVSEAPYRHEAWGEKWPCLQAGYKQQLQEAGAVIIDQAPYVFHSSVLERSLWGPLSPEQLVKETLYSFGQGLKVAVEVALIAVSCGSIAPYEDVIGVGGSGKGADTAIVLRATYPATMFTKETNKRLEIKEIIAMPISKEWWA
jgi:hypothetical protein